MRRSWKWACWCLVAKSCLTVCDPLDVSPPVSSVHGLLRQEYWSRLPFPSPGDLPDPGIEPTSPASPPLQADSFSLSHLGSRHARHEKWHTQRLSPTPSDGLPLSPTVSGTVGGSGSGIVGPEAKTNRSALRKLLGLGSPCIPRSLVLISQSKWRLRHKFVPFPSHSSDSQRPPVSKDLLRLHPRAPLHSITSCCESLPSPLAYTRSCPVPQPPSRFKSQSSPT